MNKRLKLSNVEHFKLFNYLRLTTGCHLNSDEFRFCHIADFALNVVVDLELTPCINFFFYLLIILEVNLQ